MASRLFEEILKITRPLGTEDEEYHSALSTFSYFEGEVFPGPDGKAVEVTHRGYREFFDAASRVLAGFESKDDLRGAADVMKRSDGSKMSELFATVEKLPDILKNLKDHVGHSFNVKTNKPGTESMEYYECPILIHGKRYRVNVALKKKRDHRLPMEYYFHTLRESIKSWWTIESVRIEPLD
jgi:hypothetical protein